MRYLTFGAVEAARYRICFLVPHLHKADIERFYIAPHLADLREDILAYNLLKGEKKTPVKVQREYLGNLLPILQGLGVTHLVVTDGDYFRTLTRATSTESGMGYVLDSAELREASLPEGAFKVIYCPSYRAVFYNPEKVGNDIRIALTALRSHMAGDYIAPGMGVIRFSAFPRTTAEIQFWLEKLLDIDCDLSADIEGFSLKHYDAGIGTISLAWSKHEGIAFPVDLLDRLEDRILVRSWLRIFFEAMTRRGRKLVWHNISYDVTVLIYQLFMRDLLDTEGLLHGMEVLLSQWEDTKLITYLATNSCAGNRLGLKFQAQEFAGDWGLDDEEMKDIRKIPLEDLLRYNLVDALSTWFVFEKHHPTMVADNQLGLNEGLFKASIRDIVQMQLTGMPLDMAEVKRLEVELQDMATGAVARMQANGAVHRLVARLNQDWVQKKNATLKKKRVTILDAREAFNPNSNPQLQRLIYDPDYMGLPIIDLTDTKQPSTGGETLEKLLNHTTDPEVTDFLQALLDYKAVEKLITSFLPAMLAAPMGPDGWHYLFGSFNLGGTVSGRLSSSNPNLQNIPANGKSPMKKRLAKAIKRCFRAPPGWLFCGLDFSSLEDRISALTTKDPNKLAVYTQGYDGHCLRAYSYFGDQMPDIDPASVASINSIETRYKALRQESKTPTFLLTYGGTWIGIREQLGWPEAKARSVEAKYHELYRVSDEWVADRIAEAGQRGYVEVAFGLRVRTPLLKQVILGTSKTPFEAEAEGRTAGNALGQSWCLLNNRAAAEFMGKVRTSPHRLDIRPCAHIHDAQYYMVRDGMDPLLFLNEHLVRAVAWQDDPLIRHDEVKIGGEVSVFYPNWACEMVVPNSATPAEIIELASEHHQKYP